MMQVYPLVNGCVLADARLREVVPVWFLYEDAALVFQAYMDRFDGDYLPNDQPLAAAIEAFLVDLDTVELGMVTTPAQKLEAFLGSPEYAAFKRMAA